jgi:hypothetical protein
MSTTVRPAFLRPVEFTYTGAAFYVSGGSSYTDFPKGTWANVLSLVHSVLAHLSNDSVQITLSLTDDFKLSWTPFGDITVVLNSDLADYFGFASTTVAMSNGVATIADYTPKYCWIPAFQRADQDGFSRDLQNCATGVVSTDGTWSGTSTGSAVYRTTIMFGAELETNLLVSAHGSDEQKRDRCLETFLEGALTAQPERATSVSPKGFWYYPNLNEAISQCVLTEVEPWAQASDDGVQFGYTDSPDTRVFCQTSPDQLQALRQSPSLPVSTIRYGVSFAFHTAPAPEWQYVDWGGA